MGNRGGNFDFETSITQLVLKYLAQLYNDDALSKKQIQFIVQTHIDLLKTGIFQTLKQEVFNYLELMQCDQIQKTKRESIVKLFIQYENMFHGLETEHKRSAAEDKRVQGKTTLIPMDSTAQYIPMNRVLKAFLELPGVLNQISTYMRELDDNEGPLMENFVQGDLWKKKIKRLFHGKIVLPLVVYTDDAETAELGSHMGDNQLGVIYYTILSLPPEHQSLLKNIFTYSIHYAEDKKSFCNSDVYRLLLQELIHLERDRITVVDENGESHQIYFALCLVIGDNLGLHSILGFVENFRANYHCRICRVFKNDALNQSQEDPELLRGVENYEEDVNINDYSLTSIKERCIFNVLD
ncbi:uncharacterized protein LOC107041995 isoform X2 [Diachasma alloeum]|uniref:uncharacterized protein LOC107041995 isoform X2 n=1 Tax=Diachasma alloeum TaxID=454923 RepID=UPI00073824E6|nr:uncharacterized protein LOC107041995 isoform X2 [Diachasma alloeum]